VRDADCPVIHVANVNAPPGETAQLTLHDHVDQLHAALDGRPIDVVVMHDGPSPPGAGAALAPVTGLAGVRRAVTADLLCRDPHGAVGAAHDPGRLATALRRALVVGAGSVAAPP
jgi:hypothetical protein